MFLLNRRCLRQASLLLSAGSARVLPPSLRVVRGIGGMRQIPCAFWGRAGWLPHGRRPG